jgi:dTMP kinase
MKRGAFIAVEGGDGAGKDTQVARIKELLGERAVVTRVPGGTPLGDMVRQVAVHESLGPISIPAEMFLFLADRAEQYEKVVKPALLGGKHVVSNRSWLSLIAYQVYARERHEWREFVDFFVEKLYADTPLDLVILLDIQPADGIARLKKSKSELDVIEALPLAVHERVRQGFLEAAQGLPNVVLIDANRSVEEVWADVKKAVESVVN